MTSRRSALLLLPFCALGPIAARPPEDKTKPRVVAPLRGTDLRDGKALDTAAWKDAEALVVVFLGAECPLATEYLPELARLHKAYSPKGVRFVAVNANRQDSAAKVADHAKKHALPFPVVKDAGAKIADDFGAKRTPEAFVVRNGRVVYSGRIDDQFGIGYRRAGKPNRRDLAEALDEVLGGKAVSVPRTEPVGCLIARPVAVKKAAEVTYARHVSRILQKHCQECHRPGQIGPFALGDYDSASAWAETIREAVTDGRMPPWYADPAHGKWSNDRRLSPEEKKTLLAWIDAGAPEGDPKDMPTPRRFPEGWRIGKPDVVFPLPKAFDVPAEAPKGGVPYKYFSVPTNFTEDKWVERAEAMPGAPSVVHHALVFIVPPGRLFRMDTPGAVLVGAAPGEMPMILKPGMAKKVPAGSRLVIQMHYTPDGTVRQDRTSVGVVFAKAPPTKQVFTAPVHNGWFYNRLITIPAGADDFKIEASETFRKDVRLLDFVPHMHLRGKTFKFEAVDAKGRRETLLSVPRFNFNWQAAYTAAEPVRLQRGTRLVCTATFDNSSRNPHNPDPTRRVTWGDQTWEEMMIGWVDYYEE